MLKRELIYVSNLVLMEYVIVMIIVYISRFIRQNLEGIDPRREKSM